MGMMIFIVLTVLEVGLCIWTIRKKSETKVWVRDRFWVGLIQWGVIAVLLLLPVGNKGLRFTACFIILSIRLITDIIRLVLVFWKKSKDACVENGKSIAEQHENAVVQCENLAEQRKSETEQRNAKKPYGFGRRIFGTVMSTILIATSLFPAFIFTGYDGLETTGEYEVGMVSAILTDDSRLEEFENDGSHREVPIYVYYPERKKNSASKKATDSKGAKALDEDLPKGEFPLILFSHGAFGYYQSNSSTYLELASHGYIVISMDHPYHSFFTKDTAGKTILVNMNFIQSAMFLGNAEDGEVPEEEIFETTRDWMNLRIADASFVLDEVERQVGRCKSSSSEGSMSAGEGVADQLGDAWYVKKMADGQKLLQVLSKIDLDKIGMMGHSLGGATSVTIGRTRSDVKAVIDLDGTMLGEELAYENGAYQYYDEPYPVPLLAINQESHQEDIEKYGTLYVNGWVLANAKDASYTYFKDSKHVNFTDLPLFSPFLASKLGMGDVDAKECITTMNGLVLQFFDHYLKGQGEVNVLESY